MTREEAIKILSCRDNRGLPITWQDGFVDAVDTAIEALKFRGAYEIAVKAANKAFENRWTQWVEWIPCSERLPDTDDIMLVTFKPKNGSPNVNRAYYMDGAWHGSGSMSNVTAWMPLPKPYQEDKQ